MDGYFEVRRTDPRRPILLGLAACMILVTFAYFFLDRPISTYAYYVIARPRIGVWFTYIADAPAPLAVGYLAGAAITWLRHRRPGRYDRALMQASLATLVAIATCDLLKDLCGRPWPETWINHNPSWITNGVFGFYPLHGGQGFASFPSGHTTAISAPCAVGWKKAPAWRPLWITLPCLVALGLITSDFHFLSDCLAGAFLGTACGLFLCAY